VYRLLHLTLAALLMLGATARAGDVSMPPAAGPVPATSFEARLGAFAHGLGSVEKNTVAISADLVSARLWSPSGSAFDVLIPRAYLGGMFNTAGRTSSVRAGALWTFPIVGGLFAEAFFGGAIHDGKINGDPTHNALGSRALFHVGGALGYRFDQHWSVMVIFDHMSNGNRVFGTGFERNIGINSYGVKVGYAF
jgi:lipid A 3-O-deacylase